MKIFAHMEKAFFKKLNFLQQESILHKVIEGLHRTFIFIKFYCYSSIKYK